MPWPLKSSNNVLQSGHPVCPLCPAPLQTRHGFPSLPLITPCNLAASSLKPASASYFAGLVDWLQNETTKIRPSKPHPGNAHFFDRNPLSLPRFDRRPSRLLAKNITRKPYFPLPELGSDSLFGGGGDEPLSKSISGWIACPGTTSSLLHEGQLADTPASDGSAEILVPQWEQ